MAGACGTSKLLLKRRWFAVLLATTVLSPLGGHLSAQTVVIRGARSVTPVNFNIPSQPLASALAAFGRQSGVQVSLDAAVSEGIMSQPVVGRYSPEAALQRLLSETGIAFRLTSDRTAVLASAPTGPVPDGTVQLDAVDIGGLGGGPIDGYVANTSTTAMKTNTPVLETPQSISVVTPNQIQQQGAQNVTQALQYTSGVINNPNASDLRWDAPLVRGFLAPVYLDGMLLPIGASQFARSRIDPFGLQEIDVLKGAAASALYGENTPGGLVNFVSLRPTDTPTHTIEVDGDSFRNFRGAFDIGGPVVPKNGTLFYRLTGDFNDGGTQVNYDNDRHIFIAPALTWRPDGETSLTLLGQYVNDKTGIPAQFLPAVGTLYANPHGQIPVSQNLGEPGHDFFLRNQWMAGYLFEHRFGDLLTVRQNLRYASLDTNTVAIMGAGIQPNLVAENRSNYVIPESATAFTLDNEVEKDFVTGPFQHKVLAGLDFRQATSALQENIGSAPSINLYNPVYGAPLNMPPLFAASGQLQDQIGLYLQDQIKFGHFGLTFSGRHDWVDTRTYNYLTGATTPQSDGAFSGRVALNYLFDFGLSPYVAYARSFMPNLGTMVGGTPLAPSIGAEVEGGVKYQPTGTNALLTAAVYDMTEQNYTESDPLNVGFSIQTGEVHIRGAELEAKTSLTEGLDLIASYTHNDAHIVGGAPSLAGKRVNQVPYNQAALWADYTIHVGFFRGFGFGAGLRYTGDTYGDPANTLLIPDYTLIDAALHYDFGEVNPAWKGARLAVNAFNVFNTTYVSSCQTINQCYWGNARQVRVSLRYTW